MDRGEARQCNFGRAGTGRPKTAPDKGDIDLGGRPVMDRAVLNGTRTMANGMGGDRAEREGRNKRAEAWPGGISEFPAGRSEADGAE